MDYKEKYNKLVEAVKKLQEANPSDEGLQNWLNDNVPELKGSEDEKMRKGIIRNLEYLMDRAEGFVKDELKERIAWLEKQGEQNPQGKSALESINEEKVDNANNVEPKDYNSIDPHFMKPVDKVEPKFHELQQAMRLLGIEKEIIL